MACIDTQQTPQILSQPPTRPPTPPPGEQVFHAQTSLILEAPTSGMAPLTPCSELDPFEALHTDKVRHKLVTDKYSKLYPKVDPERSRQIVNDLMTTRFNVLQQYMALLSSQYNMIDPEYMGAMFDFSISTINKICSDLESSDAEGYRKADSTCFTRMFPNPLPAPITPHVSQLRRALEDHERANTMLEQLMKGVL